MVGRTTTAFSREIDDVVAATLHYPTASVQLNVNWSDESQRKMTTKITLWGTHGRVSADRQEVQVFLREQAVPPEGYRHGWNVRYTTELTPAPYFYVRGEEYSDQLDAFVRRIERGEVHGDNDFPSALRADRAIAAIRASSAAGGGVAQSAAEATGPAPVPARGAGARELLERVIVTARDVARRAAGGVRRMVEGWRQR